MILIVSEDNDHSTNEVIDWLIYYNQEFIRINSEQFVELHEVLLNDKKTTATFSFKGKLISIDDVKSVWIRRGSLHFKIKIVSDMNPMTAQIIQHLKGEESHLSYYIHHLLSKKQSLGSRNSRHLNKILCIEKAIDAGFDVPSTWIISKKQHLQNIIDSGERLITKGLAGIARFRDPNFIISNYTELVNPEEISQTTDAFFPSLFQKAIEKAYELRVFYIDGDCYAMAIFSQGDKRTEIDFRKYNFTKPNRFVPYNLPSEVQLKVDKFMKSVKLNTGSLDILVTKDNEYIFLEVNPEGQFGMTSKPCNFYLEEKIALFLIND